MTNLVLVLMLLPLVGSLFVLCSQNNKSNAYNVTLFTLCANVLIALKLFSLTKGLGEHEFFGFEYKWLDDSAWHINFGVDVFSLVIILAVHFALIIGVAGLRPTARKSKMLLMLSLFFASDITAFLVAGDLLTFYIFFAGMLLPMFMLVGIYSSIKKSMILYRFFIYNFVGILFLLSALIMLFVSYGTNVALEDIASSDISAGTAFVVWGAICLAFLSRIPVWPFHSWISSVTVSIKNPLAYIILNMMPLVGLYGFVRFWPLSMPESIGDFVPAVELLAVLTMLVIALIGYYSRNFFYKLFSYSTVYYLFFLLAVILPTDTLKMNITYSLFIFLIVTSSLVVLDVHLESECDEAKCEHRGILAYMPRLSLMMSFFILVAVGLPISSLFWNNFVLISAIFRESFGMGLLVMSAVFLVARVLLEELYQMRDLQKHSDNALEVEDISSKQTLFLASVVAILALSFFNPLWFVF